MLKKLLLWSLWIGFIGYLVFIAPPLHGRETLSLLQKLLTFRWGEINPVIFALFSLIGVWLFIYSALLFFDGRMQPIAFWPFAVAAIATGTLGLLPYLALRSPNQTFSGTKDAFLELLDSRATGVGVLLFTLGLLVYALVWGDWVGFWQQFSSDRFINGMSLAFCLFAVLFPTILADDLARRGYFSWGAERVPHNSQLFWLIALIPLFGPLAYLCWRPPLRTMVVQ
ncbi:hypothetical protein [Gloeothece verrucosa]|uniref:DUF2834 domain-containing protein n=1 Tax=Gloeothece verrucosa (strain PCC 7822) TaxID=497965 RepID=E0U5Q1_GLOV7|nr:hypothetical protein [Gloeothece verrucosa]ADN15892.1 conserved hypothetical protein [Gloeothece verrucosa PCC 7822]